MMEVLYLFVLLGSPAELSPSTLSPVNHGMGKHLVTSLMLLLCLGSVFTYFHTKVRTAKES